MIFDPFRPPAYRRRLLGLALAMQPDCAIANGDHVYYDLAPMERIQSNPLHALVACLFEATAHRFDPAAPVLGGPNEEALIGVGDDQIAQVYGVRFRSTPVFFVTDDHDYFENDDASAERVTFPPDAFHRALRDALQHLYLPELPADRPLPDGLPGVETRHGVRASRLFAELRYGDLVNGLLYDCGGHLSLGPEAGLVPPTVERWLVEATLREDTRHLVHVPSHPMGWTAGKWREWYPDHLEHTRALVAGVERGADGSKYLWQEGWWRQHQRLVAAAASQRRRAALSVSDDLHALGALRIERSGDLDLSENPVRTVLSGPVGTGAVGWPSRARGVAPRPPTALEAEPLLALEERNGLTTLDFDRDAVRAVTWRCPEGYVAPASLAVERPIDLSVRRRG